MSAVPWCCGMNEMSGFGSLYLVGDVDAVGDVGREDLGRLPRAQLVVEVLAAGLVLDEREGFASLPMSW